MTTIIVDVENKKIYADSCVSTTHVTSMEKSIVGQFVTYDEEYMKAANLRTALPIKVRKLEYDQEDVLDELFGTGKKEFLATAIAGAGNLQLVNDFYKNYPNLDNINLNDGCLNTNILVIQNRKESLVIDSYTVSKVSRKWAFKKKYKFECETAVRTAGHIVIGSGRYYANAALLCGKTPEEAIVVASQLCPSTDSNVISFDFNQSNKEQ